MTAAFFRVPRLSTTTPIRPLILLLLWLCACKPTVDPALLGLQEEPSKLIVSFGTEQNVITGSIYVRSRPEFDGCLHGRPAFYRALEQGLNVSYCSSSLDASFQAFVDASFEQGKTAYDRLERDDIAAYILSAAALRDTIGSIRLLYCEPDCNDGLRLLESEITIVSRAFHTPDERVLPRRFYDSDMSIAITDRIWLLYRLHDSRILAIRIGDAAQAEQLYQFLTVTAPRTVTHIFQDAAGASSVTGAYSGETGGAGNERLILSSQSTPVKQSVVVKGTTFTLLLFANSSVVLRRDDPPGFRFQSIPEIKLAENGAIVNLNPEQYTPELAVPGRVALRLPDVSSFSKSGICLWSSPCSPEDIPISIAEQIDSQRMVNDNIPVCGVDDLTVTEINPFGVMTSSETSIQIGGKFIEISVSRNCANRSLHFRQTDWTAGFPDSLDAGILILAADRTLFDISVAERTILRRLKAAPLVVADAAREKTIAVDDKAVWIYGSADAVGIRRVHSLRVAPSGIVYHGMNCSGLRPDLCPSHAMTPGTDTAQPASWPTARISEILPFLDGRFIELYCQDCTGESGRLDLFIHRLSDNREERYVLPQSDMRIITLTPTSTCGTRSNRVADLYIPASAAIYRLGLIDSDGVFQQFDQLEIDTATYNLLRREKSSLSVTDDGVVLTDRALSGCEIRATPGIVAFGGAL
ncbi:hypothetical protein [Leptonema illini]|uniref:Lipoprotein n=1 Tax=Leptonema illini DSM 21528 TaxID=929563 RepID=H2CCY6_9LEPT|nr:hypothetical protein [Leptonema illini]EHQ06456.1 hypothetical protein Lepil_1773 [Leptonema illini DSM 21528]